uniref:Putative secreted protein n=1 Tax=Panstrongylus lignarius TaxID=156445 RepID=A0A224XQK9_9HEMI
MVISFNTNLVYFLCFSVQRATKCYHTCMWFYTECFPVTSQILLQFVANRSILTNILIYSFHSDDYTTDCSVLRDSYSSIMRWIDKYWSIIIEICYTDIKICYG